MIFVLFSASLNRSDSNSSDFKYYGRSEFESKVCNDQSPRLAPASRSAARDTT